jgi:hypothetical protein
MHCILVGEGMSLMASSMSTAVDMLANAMCQIATTLCPAKVAITPPQHTSANTNPNITVAIAFIESNKGLLDNELSDAECIMNNLTIASIYILMSNLSACSKYIQKQVNNRVVLISFHPIPQTHS